MERKVSAICFSQQTEFLPEWKALYFQNLTFFQRKLESQLFLVNVNMTGV